MLFIKALNRNLSISPFNFKVNDEEYKIKRIYRDLILQYLQTKGTGARILGCTAKKYRAQGAVRGLLCSELQFQQFHNVLVKDLVLIRVAYVEIFDIPYLVYGIAPRHIASVKNAVCAVFFNDFGEKARVEML